MKKKQNQIKCIFDIKSVKNVSESHVAQAYNDQDGVPRQLVQEGERILIKYQKSKGGRYVIELSNGEEIAFSRHFPTLLKSASRLNRSSPLYLKLGRKKEMKIDSVDAGMNADIRMIRLHIYEGEFSDTGRRFFYETYTFGLKSEIKYTESVEEFMNWIQEEIDTAKDMALKVAFKVNDHKKFPEIYKLIEYTKENGTHTNSLPDNTLYSDRGISQLSTKISNEYRAEKLKQEKEAV